MKRWGQPTGRAVLKRELVANVEEVTAFLERYKNHESIKAATGWIDRLLHWAAKGGHVRAREHWARLSHAGVTGQRILATQIALYVFVRLNSDFDYGRPFRLQLGHCVGRLAPLRKVRYWNAKRRTFVPASKQLTTSEREAIGDMLHTKFSRLVIQIVQHMDKARLRQGETCSERESSF
jgi:hypothetical protein